MLWRNCQSKFKNNGKMIFFLLYYCKMLVFYEGIVKC